MRFTSGRIADELFLDLNEGLGGAGHRNLNTLDDRRVRIAGHRPAPWIKFLDEVSRAEFNRADHLLQVFSPDENEHERVDENEALPERSIEGDVPQMPVTGRARLVVVSSYLKSLHAVLRTESHIASRLAIRRDRRAWRPSTILC